MSTRLDRREITGGYSCGPVNVVKTAVISSTNSAIILSTFIERISLYGLLHTSIGTSDHLCQAARPNIINTNEAFTMKMFPYNVRYKASGKSARE